jgi:AcrR family transcriptional regulator
MRRRPADGLDQVIAAALRVFADKGYRRTQMSDVAREMRVAPGTLYGYVAGKEALFHLVVDRAFTADGHASAPTLPIPTPPPGATLARLRERLAADSALAPLETALRRSRLTDARAEIEAIVGALYDRIGGAWQGIVMLERSALDWPELAHVFYVEVRRRLLQRLERYLAARAEAGILAAAPSAPAAARFVLETVAWFAMHRHRDRDADLDDETARRTTITLVANAFTRVDDRARPTRKKSRKESRRR